MVSRGVEGCRGSRVGMGCRGVELVSRFGVEVSRPGLRLGCVRVCMKNEKTVKVFSDHSQAVSKVLTEMYCQNFVQTKVLARGPVAHIDY